MCTGVELAFMFAAAAGAGMTIAQGSVDEAARGTQAAFAEIDADYEAADAKARAEKIRKAGRRQAGELNAAVGASGVRMGEGSPIVIEQNLNADVEEDALAELFSGNRREDASRSEASFLRMAGKQAKTGAKWKAAGSLLSSAGAYYGSNWIRQPAAEQSPAPIEERTVRAR